MSATPKIKVIIIGEAYVGKSSILSSFSAGGAAEAPESTLGGELKSPTYTYQGQKINFEIWDTAGQEQYRALTKIFYRDAQIAIMVYDVTKQETLHKLRSLAEHLQENVQNDIMMFVIGNKVDLVDQANLDTKEANTFANELGAIFKLTTAKDYSTIQGLFDKICEEYLKKYGKEALEPKDPLAISLGKKEKSKKSQCC